MDQVRLIEASQQGDIEGLYTIIRDCPDILDLIDKKSFVDTPLHLAAKEGRTLVDTPLHLAATERRTRFALEIMMLKPSFARKLNVDGFSPIHLALQNGNTQMVLRLVCVDPDLIRVKGRGGITPLHYAAEIGNLSVLIEFLTVCPESIEDLTIRAETALHVAVTNNTFAAFEVHLGWLKRGFYKGVRHLKEKVLNWQDDQGNSLLHIATSSNQPHVVRLLIKNGVHVNARNLEGLTALDILEQRQFGTSDIRVMLRDAKAKRAASLRNVPPLADYLRSNVSLFERFVVYLMTGISNMSVQNRNGILVFAALIVTATYQAGLNPPGGFRYVGPNLISNYGNTTTTTIKNTTTIASDPPPYSSVKPLTGLGHYILFQATNFSAFCALLGLIFFLVPSRLVVFPLGYSLLGCYTFSVISLVRPSIGMMLYLFGFVLPFFLPYSIYLAVYSSPTNQLIYSVRLEKWSRQPQHYWLKLRSYNRLLLIGHTVVLLFMVASMVYDGIAYDGQGWGLTP